MVINSAAVASAKKGVGGSMGVLAALGVTPDDWPLFFAILIGLIGGTAAAWSLERQNGRRAGRRWLVLQLASWLLIFILVAALHSYPGVTVRWAAGIAAVGAFLSRDGLTRIKARGLREIDEREIIK